MRSLLVLVGALGLAPAGWLGAQCQPGSPPAARASGAVLLRYRPPLGVAKRYRYEQADTATLLGAGRDGAGAVQFEAGVARVYLLDSAFARDGAVTRVLIAVDSVSLDSTLGPSAIAFAILQESLPFGVQALYDEQQRLVRVFPAKRGRRDVGEPSSFLTDRSYASPFPSAPVGVGDSWVAERPGVDLGAEGPVPLRVTATVQAIEPVAGTDTLVTLELRGRFPDTTVTAMRLRVPVRQRVTGELTGDEVLSLRNGVVLRSRFGGTLRIGTSARGVPDFSRETQSWRSLTLLAPP